MRLFGKQTGNGSQCLFTVAQNGYIRMYILINLGRIDIKMDHFGLFCISTQVTGHTVVKTHPHSDEYVTLIGVYVRPEVTMHSQHAFV